MKTRAKKSTPKSGKANQPAAKKKPAAKQPMRESEIEKFRKRAALILMSEEERLAATGEQVMGMMDGDPPSKIPVRISPTPREMVARNSASDVINSPGYQSLIEQLARDGLPPIARETLKANYGMDDWRLSVLLVANGKGGELERAELAQWLMNKVTELDGEEFRAFAKCMDAIKGSHKTNMARAVAVHYVRLHRKQTGRVPSEAAVVKHLLKHNQPIPEPSNRRRDLFSGPILGNLRRTRCGRPSADGKK